MLWIPDMTQFTENTTHDLWLEARQFSIEMIRTSPSTMDLKVRYPTDLKIVDGAVIFFGDIQMEPVHYPADGTQFVSNTIFSAVNDIQAVGFYCGSLGIPFPASTGVDGELEFVITITNVSATKLYYASVHASSNVLQYYPIGIQSYPLESAALERASGSYTGSIPSLPSAPTSPTPGMVYFDQQLNLVQYWDSVRSVWIPTRTDTILSGDVNPGVLGHTYLLGGLTLKVFTGTAWSTAEEANLKFLVGASLIASPRISILTELPTAPISGEFVYLVTTRRAQYWDGVMWQVPSPVTAFYDVGAGLVPAFTVPFTLEAIDLITPYVGLLFYNTVSHKLNVFNGSTWEQANTEQTGSPTTDKLGIGNDGTYDQRLRLINILKHQLGWPATCVELSEEQFNTAIDNALDTYRQLSIGAYEQRFIVWQLVPNQSVYFLNSPVDRTDAIVSVMKVHRLNMLGVTGAGPDNTWGMAFSQQFANIAAGGGHLLDVHLMHSWTEDFNKIFAGDIPFVWNEARRELFLKRIIRQSEKIVLEVELERSEQELMSDRWCKQFIQNWALAECKEYLGLIRSKFSSGTPGPAGTITLNGETLLAEARQDFTELKQSLLDYEYQNAEHGLVSMLIC